MQWARLCTQAIQRLTSKAGALKKYEPKRISFRAAWQAVWRSCAAASDECAYKYICISLSLSLSLSPSSDIYIVTPPPRLYIHGRTNGRWMDKNLQQLGWMRVPTAGFCPSAGSRHMYIYIYMCVPPRQTSSQRQDSRMDGWMDGRMDGWMDGWKL